MVQKPKIQYVGQFYVYGSEAAQAEEKPKKAKAKLPRLRLKENEKLYIDPVALCGLIVATLMLITLVVGIFQFYDSWVAYEKMSTHLADLKRENARLEHEYRTSFNLEDVRAAAESAGMVQPKDAERMTVRVHVPERPAEPTVWDDLRWFVSGLFSNPKKK